MEAEEEREDRGLDAVLLDDRLIGHGLPLRDRFHLRHFSTRFDFGSETDDLGALAHRHVDWVEVLPICVKEE